MQISSLLSSGSTQLSAINEDKSVDSAYLNMIKELFSASAYQTRDEINENDSELTQFKENLTTKGAAKFLKELNEEKIEALVEEYREKLLKEQEANPEIPMDIAKMVSDFKKKLMQDLMEIQKAEQEQKETAKQSLSTSDILSSVKMTKETAKTSKEVPNFLEQILNASNTKTNEEEIF